MITPKQKFIVDLTDAEDIKTKAAEFRYQIGYFMFHPEEHFVLKIDLAQIEKEFNHGIFLDRLMGFDVITVDEKRKTKTEKSGSGSPTN